MAVSTRTVLDVVRLSTTYLAEHGSPSARLDAELLCAHALGLRRLDLYLQYDRPLRDDELQRARDAVRRRGLQEPVAYITGERDFYGRSFEVDRHVLVPRPETETLVGLALHRMRERAPRDVTPRVADLGTGSGCIAVTLACEVAGADVVATDISDEALAVAARNAARHDVAERISFLQGDWAAPVDGALDMVVSNPPYVTTDELETADPGVREYEPRLALEAGDDGLDAYRALLASLEGRLQPAGVLLFEVDPRRGAAVTALMELSFPGCSVQLHPDLTGRPRVAECSLSPLP
ncbi:MAG: peptide chain release factor N(5)-glutamine methyltransferase [Candidatus Dormibacteraeota bacterium]|nr:peptide chain release factor N(5)-glutamine methyltransferase [Candidatus Dormibacteraeota bacterium]